MRIFFWSLVWIASVLSPKSSAQHYLSKLLRAIESYLHPANSGEYVDWISGFLVQLPESLFNRLINERYKPHPWKRAVPGMNFHHSFDFFHSNSSFSNEIPFQRSIA